MSSSSFSHNIVPDRWYYFFSDKNQPPAVHGPFTMNEMRAKSLPPDTQICNFEAHKYGSAAEWGVSSSSTTPVVAATTTTNMITATPAGATHGSTLQQQQQRTTPGLPCPSTMQSSPAVAAQSLPVSEPPGVLPSTNNAPAAHHQSTNSNAAVAAQMSQAVSESIVRVELAETAAGAQSTNESVVAAASKPPAVTNQSIDAAAAVEQYKPPPPLKVNIAPPPAAQNKKKPLAVVSTNKPAPQKKRSTTALQEDAPEPGFVDKDAMYYSTVNNETLVIVAEKLGIADWKTIANLKENTSRYGTIRGNDRFKPGTLLRIPKNYSKWKIQSLYDTVKEEMKKLETCGVCSQKERPSDPNDPAMLLCDGCDAACHVGCAGLSQVPDGDWFCTSCLDILKARRDNQTNPRFEPGTLRAVLPPLSKLAPEQVVELRALKDELRKYLRAKQAHTMVAIKENYSALMQSFPSRKAELKLDIATAKREVVYPEVRLKQAEQLAMNRLGLVKFSLWTEGDGSRLGSREEALADFGVSAASGTS